MEADSNALMLVEWGEKFPSLMKRAGGLIAIQQGEAEEERLLTVQIL